MADATNTERTIPKSQKLGLEPGKTSTVRVTPGTRYEIVDAGSDKAPQQLKARRAGENLELVAEDAAVTPSAAAASEPQVVLEGYFGQPDVQLVAGSGEAATVYAVSEMATGEAYAALGTEAAGAAALAAVPLLSPLSLAAGGAGLALAVGGGGSGGGGGGAQPPKNNIAQISGDKKSEVTEDAIQKVSGKLVVVDPDAGDAVFQAPANLKGEYGVFTFNAVTGEWTYQLDNQAIQTLREGYYLEDTLTVLSKDGTAKQDIVVTILGANDQAQISVAPGDMDSFKGIEAVDPVAPSASGTLTIGTLDYDDKIVVTGVKMNMEKSSSLDGTGLAPEYVEQQFLNALHLKDVTANGGSSNLSWEFFTGATLPEGFHLVLDYTLESVDAYGTLNESTVDSQILTIDVTGANTPVTVSLQGQDADKIELVASHTANVLSSGEQTITVNEWDYGTEVSVNFNSAKLNYDKSELLGNFSDEETKYIENFVLPWMDVVGFGDLSLTSNLTWKFETVEENDYLLKSLAEGEKLVIDYQLDLSENGIPVTAKNIEVKIDGQNDAPFYLKYGNDKDNASLEINTNRQANGTLSPYDWDYQDTIAHTVQGVTFDANNSSVNSQKTFDDLLPLLKQLLTVQFNNTYDQASSLGWEFNATGVDLNTLLPIGSTLAMDYVLRVTDNHGAWAEQKIHIELYA